MHCFQTRTETQPQVACIETLVHFAKFRCVMLDITVSKRTDIQLTSTQVAVFHTKVTVSKIIICIFLKFKNVSKTTTPLCSFFNCLSDFHFSAKSIPFSGPEASFLVTKKNLTWPLHEDHRQDFITRHRSAIYMYNQHNNEETHGSNNIITFISTYLNVQLTSSSHTKHAQQRV